MIANWLVSDDSPSASLRAVIDMTLTPTPTSAASSGSPAATNDPNVISKITAASEIATISATPPGPPPASSAVPPASTVSPASRAASAAAAISRRLPSVTSPASTE
jgi:hypothetical protein